MLQPAAKELRNIIGPEPADRRCRPQPHQPNHFIEQIKISADTDASAIRETRKKSWQIITK
jgi:hypothetical protein